MTEAAASCAVPRRTIGGLDKLKKPGRAGRKAASEQQRSGYIHTLGSTVTARGTVV